LTIHKYISISLSWYDLPLSLAAKSTASQYGGKINMMGPGHAVSGAAVGLYAATLARDLGLLNVGVAASLTGAALCAGAALIPDLDHPNATVAKAFGPASAALARVLNECSSAVYRATKTAVDEDRDGGHRGLTHTLVFAAALGGLVALLARVLPGAVPGVLFVLLVLALRGLIPSLHKKMGRPGGLRPRRRRRLRAPGWLRRMKGMIGIWLVAAALTWLLADAVPSSDIGAWLGAMVALGCLTHCAGDAITEMGCPILWPVPIAGERWFLIGPPRPLRFKAGGGVERWLVMPVLVLVTGVLTVLAVPDVADMVALLLP
jgi:membrane-bound metal-dependent hydrolase YbcI (DUF457 family)